MGLGSTATRPAAEALTRSGFLGAALVVAFLGAMAYWESGQQEIAAGWVAHTQEVLAALAGTRAAMADLQSSHLAYVITNSPASAGAEQAQQRMLEEQVARVRQLTQDNPQQKTRLGDFEMALAPWISSLQKIATARRSGATTDADESVDSTLSTQQMEALRARLDAIELEERNLLHDRMADHQSLLRWVRWAIGGLVACLAIALLLLFRQITRQHQQREQMLQSEQRFHLLARSVVDYGIFLLDPTGHVESWNMGAERIKGYREREILGQHFSRFYPQDEVDANKPLRALEIAEAEGRFEEESWRMRKDGSRFWAHVVITALRDDADQLTGFAKVTRDLTERKRAEDALRAEMEERRRVDEKLQVLNKSLELQVAERTSELSQTNARLVDAKLRLQDLSTRLIAGQEEERGRIARELHDTTGQSLTGIRIRLDMALRRDNERVRYITESIEVVDEAVAQVRNISLNLRPLMLDDLGLSDALEWVLEQQAATAGWHATLVGDTASTRLSSEVETACFRIAQEAMTNIARHAAAKNVEIRLGLGDNAFELSVTDDGKGFDPALVQSPETRRAHFGLVSMTERAELAGGNLQIITRPGEGTTVRVRFPLV